MLAKFVVPILLVLAVDGAPTDFKNWQENLANTEAFPCKDPQPRAFEAAKLLGDKLRFTESAVPHTAVLHRCDESSGCCNNAFEICGPTKKEAVELTFWINSKEGQRYEVYAGKNETQCGCKYVGNDIIK